MTKHNMSANRAVQTQYPLADQGVDSDPTEHEQRICHDSHGYSVFLDVLLVV